MLGRPRWWCRFTAVNTCNSCFAPGVSPRQIRSGGMAATSRASLFQLRVPFGVATLPHEVSR
jgi:hypothetical protein